MPISPEEREMERRYSLLIAIRAVAEEFDDLPSAERASQIASSIAMQNVHFKDIIQQRTALNKIVQKLRNT